MSEALIERSLINSDESPNENNDRPVKSTLRKPEVPELIDPVNHVQVPILSATI